MVGALHVYAISKCILKRTIITYSHRVNTCKYIYVFRQGGLVGIGGILLIVLSIVLGMFSGGG